ncbi:MAG TPA: hypothetical protein VK086_02740 [Ruania sp.]|nr:hypothetical protein [Ruania sp.]
MSGQDQIEAAVAAAEDLGDQPLTEQVAVFEQVLSTLQERLADAEN